MDPRRGRPAAGRTRPDRRLRPRRPAREQQPEVPRRVRRPRRRRSPARRRSPGCCEPARSRTTASRSSARTCCTTSSTRWCCTSTGSRWPGLPARLHYALPQDQALTAVAKPYWFDAAGEFRTDVGPSHGAAGPRPGHRRLHRHRPGPPAALPGSGRHHRPGHHGHRDPRAHLGGLAQRGASPCLSPRPTTSSASRRSTCGSWTRRAPGAASPPSTPATRPPCRRSPPRASTS